MLCEVYKTVNYPGGIERVLCNFSNEFIRRGHSVTYVCLDTEKGMPFYNLDSNVYFLNLCFYGDSYFGFNYHWSRITKELKRLFGGARMMFGGKKLYDPKKAYFETEYIKRLKMYLRCDKPDVIICADSQCLRLVQCACDNNIPTIAMCHVDPDSFLQDAPAEEITALRRAACVQVLVDSFIKKFDNYGIYKTKCIPNAVDIPPVIDFQRSYDNNAIIYVGRMEKVLKRPHLLIESFAEIAKKHKTWKVKFFGSEDDKRYKRKMVRFIEEQGLSEQVSFCGTSNKIIDEMLNADILVNTSKSEGFGLAVAEAMSVGLPIIGFSDCCALHKLIDDGYNGYLVDGVKELSEKLDNLMESNDLRKTLGDNSMKKVKFFSSQKVWDDWERLINEVLL